jgi:SGNH domain (fused to AT3 domains)
MPVVARRPTTGGGQRLVRSNPVMSGLVATVAAVICGGIVHLLVPAPAGDGRSAGEGRQAPTAEQPATAAGRTSPTTDSGTDPSADSSTDSSPGGDRGRRPFARAGRTADRSVLSRIDLDAVRPDPRVAVDDKGDQYEPGCHQYDEPTLRWCASGDLRSDRVMALVGDSHAAQWQPALDVLARRHGWRLETYTKSACGFVRVDIAIEDAGAPLQSCTAWNTSLLERLTGTDRPDLVVTSGSDNYKVMRGTQVLTNSETDRRYVAGLRRSWVEVQQSGVPVAVIRNTPRMGFDVPGCVVAHAPEVGRCTRALAQATKRSAGAQSRAAAGLEDVQLIDLNGAICPAATCTPTIGNLLVWRDEHHMTATFARSLAPRLDTALRPLIQLAEAGTGYRTARS